MPGAAIFHHPDAVEAPDTPLAGRRTAGQSFLAGLIAHGPARLTGAAATEAHAAHFRKTVESLGRTEPVDTILLDRPGRMGDPGVLHLPGPNLASYAWTRRRVGQRRYSLSGITHTISTRRIADGLRDLLSAPVESWDAIICTSRAVQSAVAVTLDETEAYLRQRFAAARLPRPQLPIVPLGVDTAAFAADPEARARWRDRYAVPPEGIAVLSMGRLSMFEKMHPAPMLIALERAQAETGVPLTLLMTGWFADKGAEDAHRAAARAFAPSVRVVFPDGRDPQVRREIWSAGDIFLFPVDNVQETFGLAPVEAMAAGLPVVCSDWDGLRDTIEHGVTGFRAPVLMSPPGHGQHLADRFEDGRDSYHQYLGFVHQRTAVDLRRLVEALVVLIRDPDRRAAMGAAGRDRARRLYDWAAVIPQFQAVWADLDSRRDRERSVQDRGTRPANPASIDPFRLFAGYPGGTLPGAAIITLISRIDRTGIEHLIGDTGARRIRRMVAPVESILAVIDAIAASGPVTVDDLGARLDITATTLDGVILWLAKFGIVEIGA